MIDHTNECRFIQTTYFFLFQFVFFPVRIVYADIFSQKYNDPFNIQTCRTLQKWELSFFFSAYQDNLSLSFGMEK